ncbi:MAG: type III-A CRISPR-associated RAMP protein Csm5 [Caldimicrobium sp.]|nr:type III-A CRISPR-associated RAMP protein Csm5 [Caldimicrobium sp.]
MSSFLRKFKIKLELLSPVHIGCDEVYSPLSFVIDPDSKLMYIFDIYHLNQVLSEKNRNKIKEIAEIKGISALIELYKFYRNVLPELKKISHAKRVPDEFVQTYKRVLDIKKEEDIYKSFNNLTIPRTFFNPHTQQPVIPGSSLKGALRTGYLEGLYKNKLENSPQSLAEINANIQSIKPNTDKGKLSEIFDCLQRILLGYQNKDISYDPFKLLKVSDLTPTSKIETEILYTINLKKQKREAGRGISLPIEVLPIGSTFVGEITLFDLSKIPIGKIDIPEEYKVKIHWQALINANFNHYLKIFKDEQELAKKLDTKFISLDKNQIEAIKAGRGLILKLGRHSGAEAVTIDGVRKITIRTTGNQKVIRDSATTWWIASNSRQNISGGIPLGWVYLEFVEDAS